MLVAELHAVGVLTLEEVVARGRGDDVAPAVDVTEGEGVEADVKAAVFAFFLALDAGVDALV